jgi:hypothetical protein
MSQTIVNLVLPVISTKVEAALQDIPSHSWQSVDNTPALREWLISYVLKHIQQFLA